MNIPTWVEVRDICHEFGVSFATAKNQIYLDRFPVPTYKVGKKIVVDRTVLDLYRERVRNFQIERFRSLTQPK
jgi:predicted site-specific integrase-resolvase